MRRTGFIESPRLRSPRLEHGQAARAFAPARLPLPGARRGSRACPVVELLLQQVHSGCGLRQHVHKQFLLQLQVVVLLQQHLAFDSLHLCLPAGDGLRGQLRPRPHWLVFGGPPSAAEHEGLVAQARAGRAVAEA